MGDTHGRLKRDLAAAMTAARQRTLAIAAAVEGEDRVRRPHPGYSPFDWHLGHIAMTEGFWTLQKAHGRPSDYPALDFRFANIPQNPKDDRALLPPRDEILQYGEEIRERVLECLERADFESPNPLLHDGYCFRFSLAHEWQHQEALIELLHLLGSTRAIAPLAPAASLAETAVRPGGGIEIPAGEFMMGTNDPNAYDNEQPAHAVFVGAFVLDEAPVTAGEYDRFREDGGYRRQELWNPEGWRWLQAAGVDGPEYERQGPFGPRVVHPREPAASVSWYEAAAFARWAGKRLPTEAEWERAAAYDPETGRSRVYPWGDDLPDADRADCGARHWRPLPVGSFPLGRSALGSLDMGGGVWEWTSTVFEPYRGFVSFPYTGYSQDHFTGDHRVLKGGSWATAGPLLRCSFRNFYTPEYRQGFLGFRCARTI